MRTALVLLALWGVACVSREKPPPLTGPSGDHPAIQLGVLDFTLDAYPDKKPFKLSSERGKVVLLDVWATWCDPCREEMPAMQRLQERLAGKLVVLAVDYGEGPPRIKDFLKKVPVRFTVLLDRDTSAATAWKVKVLPTTLVIDPDQKVRYVAVGDVGWDTQAVEEQMRTLLPSH